MILSLWLDANLMNQWINLIISVLILAPIGTAGATFVVFGPLMLIGAIIEKIDEINNPHKQEQLK